MKRNAFAVMLFLHFGCDRQPQPENRAMDPRATLLQRIGDINDFDRPRPLVSLELFFDGNDDPASIGYNLPDPPAPREFHELLKGLRDRDDVRDVLIEVKDMEDPDGWPSTDTIWFITSAPADDVQRWFPEALAPDDVIVGFGGQKIESYDLPNGFEAVGAWHD